MCICVCMLTVYHSVQNLLASRLLSKNLKINVYRIIILPVVLYGCETWSLTLSEERRLRVFENRVLRKVFGPKRDEVTGEWTNLHNEELNDMYFLPNIVRVVKSRRMRWAGHVARMGEDSLLDNFFNLIVPTLLSLVGGPLSGKGCGSRNHTYMLFLYYVLIY
jgi:hypothetical protein